MQADVVNSHIALDLSFWDEGGDRVHNYDVDRAGADQLFCDIEGLFAVVRL